RLRELVRVRAAAASPAPDTETPPGGGGRTGRSPPASKGPSGLIQRRSIGTLAKRAQVGKCGSVSQRSNVAQIVCSSCVLAAIAVRCTPESLAHAHCAVRARYSPEHGHDSSSGRVPRRRGAHHRARGLCDQRPCVPPRRHGLPRSGRDRPSRQLGGVRGFGPPPPPPPPSLHHPRPPPPSPATVPPRPRPSVSPR